MNKYLATVRVQGRNVKTAVFAESALHARLILEFQFGIGSVVSTPVLTSDRHENHEAIGAAVESIKIGTPQQARIDSLKRQKELISKSLETERNRQKEAKARQQLHLAMKSTL
jgi:hypothetical protein